MIGAIHINGEDCLTPNRYWSHRYSSGKSNEEINAEYPGYLRLMASVTTEVL